MIAFLLLLGQLIEKFVDENITIRKVAIATIWPFQIFSLTIWDCNRYEKYGASSISLFEATFTIYL